MPTKHEVATDRAPAAIGPYSQAITAGELVFTAGCIALDPKTGAMVEGGIGPETHQALSNLKAVLEAAGSGLDSVLKTTVYLADLADYGVMNGIYAEYFAAPHPARSAVEAAALPKGARVEIDAVALRSDPR